MVASMAIMAGVVVGGWCLAPDVHSQSPASTTPNSALLPLINKLKSQQEQLVANQSKIEAQTALLKEELRQAKIYSARAGAGHR